MNLWQGIRADMLKLYPLAVHVTRVALLTYVIPIL